MRQIKFRVWDNVDYMSHPFTLQDIQSRQIQFTSDCIVLQYTGLKDKNDKEVYEEDIVKTEEGDLYRIWIDAGVMLYGDLGKESDNWLNLLPHGFEVVGNIYETPHLLNSEQGSTSE